MGRHNPFIKRRPNPKRKEPRRVGNGRVKLYGDDMTDLRRKAFERSGGRCEMMKILSIATCIVGRCNAPITWETMELCHDEHGPRKSDELAKVKAGCKECHRNQHNAGGKPCKRRPGKVMPIKDAKAYWSGKVCFCEGPKKPAESFCPDCALRLTEQTRHTLEHADNPNDYREALAEAEIEIMKAKG